MASGDSTIDDMTWWRYVQIHSGGAPNAHIAKLVGITASSVGRWGKGSGPDPAQAAAFARAYGRPVLEAFLAADYLTPEEAGEKPSAAPSLASLDDDELLAEVRKRMKGGSSDSGQDEAEKSSDSGGGSGASVTQLHPWEEPRPADTFDPHDQRRVASRPSQEEREARRQAEAESAHIDDENQDPGDE